MSYHRKHTNGQPVALGGVVSAISTAVGITQDPYFNEAVCRVQQIRALENKQPLPACATTPANLTGGAGLRKMMPPLRAYVYAEKHPWTYAAAVVGVLGLPMLLGYALGRSR